MAASYGPQTNPGLLLGTTNSIDPSLFRTTEINSPEFKELLVKLTQYTNSIQIALNLKDSAYYVQTEFMSSQNFFPNTALSSTTPQAPVFRSAFRKVINFGALPNAGTKSVPHGILITDTYSFTRIYGAATDQTAMGGIPLPYASTVALDNIELWVDAVNVNVRTTADYSNYTVTYIILEYIKQ